MNPSEPQSSSPVAKAKATACGPANDTSAPIASAETPLEVSPAEIGFASEVAGGIPAIVKSMGATWEEAGLVRGARALLNLNQKDGFDCPGCAWPDPDGHRTHNEYCENGAKAVAEEATTKRVTPEFFSEWSVSELSHQSDHWLGKQGRLTHPMALAQGGSHYLPISWDEAFALIGKELNGLASPNQAVFYTSGRTSNEAAFLYQLFVREFGTNNLPDCSNMCHESSGVALSEVIGVSKGTITLDDFDRADAIFVIGQNPGTNHPRMLTSLQRAVRNGCKVVSVNPLPEVGLSRFKHPQDFLHILGSGSKIASLFLQVRINGDSALLKGIMKEMLEEEQRRPGEVLDREFIAGKTFGFEEFARALEQVEWVEIVEQSGISRKQIRVAAEVAMRSQRTICTWAMGLTQHKAAVATIQEVINFLLLRGNIGRPGTGACPVRGHSNVQGDRTMGIYEKPSQEFLERLGQEFGFTPSAEHGLDTVGAIRAMHDGRAKVFIAMGGNFLSATPDTDFTAAALRKTRLTVHVSTKLNRAHLISGTQALILPCLGRTERDAQESGRQFVTVENSMGVVHSSRGKLSPVSEHLLSEPAIVAGIAQVTLGKKTRVQWAELVKDYDRIRAHIENVVPGFENFNARSRKPGGFYLPNPARDGQFETRTGKAIFSVHPLVKNDLRDGQFLMTTIRSHDQYNTTIYGLDDRYRGIYNGRRVIFLNKDDMAERGWSQGQRLDITSHFQGQQRTAKSFIAVPYNIPRDCAATYFPEANVLVPIDHVAAASNTPASKSVVITLEPSAADL